MHTQVLQRQHSRSHSLNILIKHTRSGETYNTNLFTWLKMHELYQKHYQRLKTDGYMKKEANIRLHLKNLSHVTESNAKECFVILKGWMKSKKVNTNCSSQTYYKPSQISRKLIIFKFIYKSWKVARACAWRGKCVLNHRNNLMLST